MTKKTYTVLHPFTCGSWAYRSGDMLKPAELEARGFSDTDLARHVQRGEIDETQVVEARQKIERIAAAATPQAPSSAPAPEPNS